MNTDDTITVRMRVDVEVKVSRSEWRAHIQSDEEPNTAQDVRAYMRDNVIPGWTSTQVLGLGGTVSTSVVEEPRSFLVLEGYELDSLANSLLAVKQPLHTLRVEPRPDGLSYKINEGMWSPTVGKRVNAE
jgi:hypothetical protein